MDTQKHFHHCHSAAWILSEEIKGRMLNLPGKYQRISRDFATSYQSTPSGQGIPPLLVIDVGQWGQRLGHLINASVTTIRHRDHHPSEYIRRAAQEHSTGVAMGNRLFR